MRAELMAPARWLQLAPAGRGAPLLSGPDTIGLQRSVEAEFPVAEYERLVALIREAADGDGQPSIVGRTLTWRFTSSDELRSLLVTVSSDGDGTRIRIQERLGQLAAGLYGGIVGGVGGGVGPGVGLGVGLGALGSTAFAIAWPVATLLGSAVLARTIYRSVSRRRQRALLDSLTDEVSDAPSAAVGRYPLVGRALAGARVGASGAAASAWRLRRRSECRWRRPQRFPVRAGE